MERRALPPLAEVDAGWRSAVGLRWLRRQLEPVRGAVCSIDAACHLAAWVASVVAVAVFSAFAVSRHRVYESTAYDFGFFDQIVWNTSRGDWFETSFLEYNFLGQHFEPILLLFAGFYRLGGGPETMLLAQSLFAGSAAIPLFYATRRMTGSPVAGLSLSLAYLLNPALHRALDFDFHPEVMAFPFVFGALYFVAARRPWAATTAILPVLLLKEDMAILVLGFAAILWLSQYRKQAWVLGVTGLTWIVVVMFILMPSFRDGPSDLNQRFAYLTRDTEPATLLPVSVWRGMDRLATSTAPGVFELEVTLSGLAVLHPAAMLAAVPAASNGLSDHAEQSRLDLQYAVAPLALSIVAAAYALGDIANGRRLARAVRGSSSHIRMVAGGAALLLVSTASFFASSPYSPLAERKAPEAAHRQAIAIALDQIPAGASVSAQGTLLPHLSQRREVWEFPDLRESEYVIVDSSLPVTAQARAAGYESVLSTLPARGYSTIWESRTVRVFRRGTDE